MNSFTIYKDYIDLITLLPNKREQSELLLAICNYMFFDEEPNLNESQMKIFRNLKRPLDKSKKRGKSGSITLSNNNQDELKEESNQNQNEIKMKSNKNQKQNKVKTHQDVNVYVNDNDNDLEKIGYREEKPLKADDSSLLLETTKKVVAYLNEKTGSNFRYSSKATQSKVNARLNEGYTFDNFITVINKKFNEWTGTEFERYLCPETLFGTKFEKYLNQKVLKSSEKEKVPNWFDKKIESKKPTPEEEQELNEILKSLEG